MTKRPTPFSAVASPVRRGILDLLREHPRSTGEVAGAFPRLSRFAVMQHLGVLKRARLVVSRKDGRFRVHHLNPAPLQEMYDRWVSRYARLPVGMALSIKSQSEKPVQQEVCVSSNPIKPASITRVEIEVRIAAPQERVWQAMLHEAGAWWRKDFFTSPKTRAFVIEPRVGGRAYEDYGDGNGAMWFTVHLLDAPNRVQFVGHMGGSFPGPCVTIIEINLSPAGEGTLLRLSDQVIGNVDEKLLKSLDSGWRMLFEESLKAHVEGSGS